MQSQGPFILTKEFLTCCHMYNIPKLFFYDKLGIKLLNQYLCCCCDSRQYDELLRFAHLHPTHNKRTYAHKYEKQESDNQKKFLHNGQVEVLQNLLQIQFSEINLCVLYNKNIVRFYYLTLISVCENAYHNKHILPLLCCPESVLPYPLPYIWDKYDVHDCHDEYYPIWFQILLRV